MRGSVLGGWSSMISKYGCLPGVKKVKNIKKTCKKAGPFPGVLGNLRVYFQGTGDIVKIYSGNEGTLS